jgi:monoterpene epsilon-lactone hydrolase
MYYTFHTNEWNGSGNKEPTIIRKYLIYYIFNLIIVVYKYILCKSPLYAFNTIFRFCKQFQVPSLTEIRQPVLAYICPPSKTIQYIPYKTSSGLTIYKVLSKKQNKQAVLYIHGGGLISGDFAGYKGFCEDIVNHTNSTVFFPAYHFAPEYSVQTALNDIIETYTIILNSNIYDNIYIIADSGGGVLALLAIYKLIKRNDPLPTKCILLSPVTDLTCSSESFQLNSDADVALDVNVTKWALTLAGSGKERLYSPVFYKYPSNEIHTIEFIFFIGIGEILYNDSTRMVDSLKKSGYNVTLYATPNVFHSWPLFWKYFPEGESAFRRIVSAIAKKEQL